MLSRIPVFWQRGHGLPKDLALFSMLLGAVAAGPLFLARVDGYLCFLAAAVSLGGATYLGLGEHLSSQLLPAPSCQHHHPLTDPRKRPVLKPDVFKELRLAEKTIFSHNVAIYRFKLPSPESILGLPVSQHISIGAAIKKPDGSIKEVIRSYTPISGDDQPGYFDLLIKAYPNGNISQLMTSLSIGQSIRVRGPKGSFTYAPNMVRRFGMIAGGTGITPMLQIIKAIIRGRSSGDKTEADLIFANVTEQDILLKEELDGLAQDAGIRVRYVLDRPPQGWGGGVGYITADMIRKWLPAPGPDIKILLCGPPPMVGSLKKVTEGLEYQKTRAASKVEDQVFSF